MSWLIRCKSQPTLFWSNSLGWTARSEAEFFTDDDKAMSALPIDGEWLRTRRKA